MSKITTQLSAPDAKRIANSYLKYHNLMVEVEKPEVEKAAEASRRAWEEYREQERKERESREVLGLKIDALREIIDIEKQRRRPDKSHIQTLQTKLRNYEDERGPLLGGYWSPPFPHRRPYAPFTRGAENRTRKQECKDLITLADSGDGYVTVGEELAWLLDTNWTAKTKEAKAALAVGVGQ